ncbi:hypothetical protein F4859DRAFT_501284 [Xylaria cf. heliscus]|nr:hypothetical protein F4859DRAFT_501284 [Xylaria cf. heliscus]
MAAAPGTAGALPKTFRAGTKKVFLPSHAIMFLAPRPNQLPTFATFKVPLTFNKFDIRDYLFHVYNTPVLAVRSQVRQRREFKRHVGGRRFIPPPIKTMTVQLTQPFKWPSMPTDITPWKSPTDAKAQSSQRNERRLRYRMAKLGEMPMRDEQEEPEGRKNLRKEAERLLREGGWTNKRDLDPRFSEDGEVKKRARV